MANTRYIAADMPKTRAGGGWAAIGYTLEKSLKGGVNLLHSGGTCIEL